MAGDANARQKILDAVNNDLNSAEAFAVIDNVELSLENWRFIDELFGLRLIADTPDLAEECYALLSERAKARANRDFAKSDELRDKLAAAGINVRDTAAGQVWGYLK